MDNCFEAARRHGVKHTVFASSLAVSGAQSNFGDCLVNETDERHGNTQYAINKIMNEWQVKHNGEPFWMGWAEADLIAIMKAAGYPEEHCFAEHAGNGPVWFVHGSSKPA